jgi:hypothetical protein
MTPIDLSKLEAPQLAAYFDTADRRITSGFRLALQILNIAVPTYAERKPSGPRRLSDLMADLDRDTGTIRTYHDEKKQVGAFAPRNS